MKFMNLKTPDSYITKLQVIELLELNKEIEFQTVTFMYSR